MGNFLLSFIFVGSLFLPSFERSYLFEAPRLCNGFLIFFSDNTTVSTSDMSESESEGESGWYSNRFR